MTRDWHVRVYAWLARVLLPWSAIEVFRQDLRFGVRAMRRSRGTAGLVVLTLEGTAAGGWLLVLVAG